MLARYLFVNLRTFNLLKEVLRNLTKVFFPDENLHIKYQKQKCFHSGMKLFKDRYRRFKDFYAQVSGVEIIYLKLFEKLSKTSVIQSSVERVSFLQISQSNCVVKKQPYGFFQKKDIEILRNCLCQCASLSNLPLLAISIRDVFK